MHASDDDSSLMYIPYRVLATGPQWCSREHTLLYLWQRLGNRLSQDWFDFVAHDPRLR